MTAEQFKGAFKSYYEASSTLIDASHNRLEEEQRKALASRLDDDDPIKETLLHGSPRDCVPAISGLVNHRKTAVDDALGDGTSLEEILNGMGKDFIDFAVQATKPKKDYTGQHAEDYKKASELRIKLQGVRELAESRDSRGLQEALIKDYKAKYEKKKEALAMAIATIEADDRTVARLTQIKMAKLQEQIDLALKDHKAGYVIATRDDMQDKDTFPMALVKLRYNLDNSKRRENPYLE